MKLSSQEFCARMEAAKVESAEASMKMKKGAPYYRVKYALETGGDRAEQSLSWRSEREARERIGKALIALAGGPGTRITRGSKAEQWTHWKARIVFVRLKQTVIGYSKRSETKGKIAETQRVKKRDEAMGKLVESMKELLRVHPHANKGDVIRAYEAAKRHEIVRHIMEE